MMADRSQFAFADYVLDGETEQLWREQRPLRLTNKAFAVLYYLVEHPGQLVTKDALLTAVWPNAVVSETTLTNCIGELRRALGDEVQAPRFIETVHRRGYRFIEQVVSSQQSEVSRGEEESQKSNVKGQKSKVETPAPTPQPLAPVLVGREAEFTHLHTLFAKAMTGERQLVFVTGEAGIGKTTLIEAFRQRLEAGDWRLAPSPQASSLKSLASSVSFAHGQCIEQYGAGEAYLPILEALGRLGRGAQKARLLSVLQQYAPTWLEQLPALLSAAELEAVHRRTQGATRERMLREIVEALEVLSTDQPMILVLEDFHWSDPSTVDVLALLARRRELARLLVLGTYRGAELAVSGHPLKTLKHDLVARGYATEVALSFLSAAAVRDYVGQRVAEAAVVEPLADVVYRRTDGQPLFMVQVTDYLIERGGRREYGTTDLTRIEQGIPQGLQAVIEAQLARLTAEEHDVLAVGSVNGAEFTVASVAAGLGQAEATIETLCDRLARRGHFIVERGVQQWPDGTVSGRYGFRHALYQEVLYTSIAAARRVRVHHAIAERLERGYGERAQEIAAELVVHCERGHVYPRAVAYCYHAGQNAKARAAYAEALMHVTAGLSLLASVSDTAEQRQQELQLQMARATILQVTKGAAAVESANAYRQALALAHRSGAKELTFVASFGLWLHSWMRGELPLARQQGEHLLALAHQEHLSLPDFVAAAHRAVGGTLYFLGDLVQARAHFEHAVAIPKNEQAQFSAFFAIPVFGGLALAYVACTLWLLGYADQAQAYMHDALAQAQDSGIAYDLAATLAWSLMLHQFLHDAQAVDTHCEQLLQLSATQGFARWTAVAKVFQGWARSDDAVFTAARDPMLQALAAFQAGGARLHLPYFLGLVADVYHKKEEWKEGLRLVADAFVVMEETDQRLYEAELWRLKGELTLQGERQKAEILDPQSLILDPTSEAEECFLKAIAVACTQHAKSLELRAVMSLVRLRQLQSLQPALRTTQHGLCRALTDAHRMLSEVYNWFAEGFETKDLQEAKALIEDFGGNGKWIKG